MLTYVLTTHSPFTFLEIWLLAEKSVSPDTTMLMSVHLDIKCNRVSYLFCPMYKGLSLHDILAKIDEFPEVEAYLPD